MLIVIVNEEQPIQPMRNTLEAELTQNAVVGVVPQKIGQTWKTTQVERYTTRVSKVVEKSQPKGSDFLWVIPTTNLGD